MRLTATSPAQPKNDTPKGPKLKLNDRPSPALRFSGASDSKKAAGGLFDKFVKPFQKTTLQEIAEKRRQNTVLLQPHRSDNLSGSGVLMKDGKKGDHFILTCRHLLSGRDDDDMPISFRLGEPGFKARIDDNFDFSSRNPASGEIVTGIAEVDKIGVDRSFGDCNDLMLLKIRPGSCSGPLNVPFIPLAERGRLIFSRHLHEGDPAIICSSGFSTGQGALDKVTLGRFKSSVWNDGLTDLESALGSLGHGDSGSAVYDEVGRLTGIFKGFSLYRNGVNIPHCLSLFRLQQFLREQCGLHI